MQKSILTLIIILHTSCANIVAPTGGKRDIDPPKIKNITIVKNDKKSLNNVILFEFDENIQLNNWDENFYISPIIKNLQKKIKGKFLYLSIKDTLHKNKSYNISLGQCIKDINEGNILDTLSYIYNDNNLEHTVLSGVLKDSYTLEYLENYWIMLFDEKIEDSLLIKNTPKYISKTDKKGRFHFPNLINENYKILALSGFDLIFNTDEKIAFLNRKINTVKDTFISLLAFKENIENETIDSNLYIKKDSLIERKESVGLGQLEIITELNSSSIFQLLQKNKVVSEHYFDQKPFLIKSIEPGKYQLKCIEDRNEDKIWNTGNLQKQIQPEKVFNYQSEILIRSNWDLEIEWVIIE